LWLHFDLFVDPGVRAVCSIADAVGKYPVAAVEIVVAFIFGW
jgi:hypothetical protein